VSETLPAQLQVQLAPLNKYGVAWAQDVVTERHYLRKPIDPRCSVEGYEVRLPGAGKPVGLLLFGRPEATRCANWYGSVEDVQAGRCEVTRWQILNLARVWIDPEYQPGGAYCDPMHVPGFFDRRGAFRSTLASEVLKEAVRRIGLDYLVRRPPCFLDEPYELRSLLSYCDLSRHKGTIYAAAGFELYRTNDRGIQTWRIRLPELSTEEDREAREASRVNARSIKYRAQRAQLSFKFQ